jgi:transglutaminase-like putative cysteine protease
MFRRLFSLFLCLTFYLLGAQSDFKKAVPAWVKQLPVPTPNTDLEEGGLQFLLFDNQIDFSRMSSYVHVAVKLENTDKIQQYSELYFDYDPSYQKFAFHMVRVHRKGAVIDKLATHNVQSFQRESNLEERIYNGSFTASVSLSDIRKGDILEYAYSYEGHNPAFPNHYYDNQVLAFDVPVGRLHYAVTAPDKLGLTYTLRNGASKPKQEKVGATTTYTWDLSNIEPFDYYAYTPAWDDKTPDVSFSNYKNWNQVVQDALPMYTLSFEDQWFIKKVIGRFDQEHIEDRLLAAIRFVQDDIRYLGMEGGLNDFKPHSPKQIFEQRFGDCKDKSLLLASMLTEMGHKAYPMLVNSRLRKGVEHEAVSPYAFDHCVVKLLYGEDKVIYIDPTYNEQGGDLLSINFPDYGRGLVVKRGEDTLDSIQAYRKAKTYVLDELRFEVDQNKTASLKVTSEYYGLDADNQRAYLSSRGKGDLQRDYLNYYSNVYPQIRALGDVEISDDLENNRLSVIERYEVDSIWEPEKGYKTLAITSGPFRDFTSMEREANRQTPYQILHPRNIQHQSTVYLPEEWSIEEEEHEIDRPAYAYQYGVQYTSDGRGQHMLILKHNYESKANQVNVVDYTQFVDDYEEMYQESFYSLSYSDTNSLTEAGGFPLGLMRVFLWLLYLGSFIAFALLARRVYRNYDPAPQRWAKGITTISGWLYLPAIGLFLTPFRMLYEFVREPIFFESSNWLMFLSPDNPAYEPGFIVVLLFGVVGNIYLFCLSILTLILYIKRRTSAPRVLIVFYSSMVVLQLLDWSIYTLVAGDLGEPMELFNRDFIRALIAAGIWIPVFLLSDKVKETFNETYRQLPQPIPEVQVAEPVTE